MPKSASSSTTTSDGDRHPGRDAVYSIESTIQAAIDRAADGFEDSEGRDIDALAPAERWRFYAAEMDYMAGSWSDFYPLAPELATLRPNVLARLWKDLVG